jgi:hypothetical protein
MEEVLQERASPKVFQGRQIEQSLLQLKVGLLQVSGAVIVSSERFNKQLLLRFSE